MELKKIITVITIVNIIITIITKKRILIMNKQTIKIL